jgi:hypothetical protein
MVAELRRRIIARAKPFGVALPIFFLSMAGCVLLLTTDFLKEPIVGRWLVGVIAIGLIAALLGIRIGLTSLREARSITTNHFGTQEVPTGAPGRGGSYLAAAVTEERMIDKALL